MTKILLSLLAIYAVVVLISYLMQRQLMYFPAAERVAPADVGLANIREIELTTDNDVRLYSWYGEARDGMSTLLFFHGNAGSVAYRAERFVEFMGKGYGVFMLGYPGYGGSGGTPSEDSFVRASRIAYGYLREQGIAAEQIVIYGESIGTGVAVQLAARVDARALILEAPMASTTEVASAHYPFLPVSLLIKDSWLSIDYIDRINMPLLVMHGTNDQIIPIDSGRNLFDKALEPKQFVPVNGAGHNNLTSFPIAELVHGFLAR